MEAGFGILTLGLGSMRWIGFSLTQLIQVEAHRAFELCTFELLSFDR